MLSKVTNLIAMRLNPTPFVWSFFSIILFFCAFAFLFAKHFFPVHYSLIFMVFLALIFFFRVTGLYIALGGMLPFFYSAFHAKAIVELTLLYSMMVALFTLLLSLEEEIILSKQDQPVSDDKEAFFERQKKEFQETLEQLKEEAERRYLEYSRIKQEYQILQEKLCQAESENAQMLLEKKNILNCLDEERRNHLVHNQLWEEKIIPYQHQIDSLEKKIKEIEQTLAGERIEKEEALTEKKVLLEQIFHSRQEMLVISDKWEVEKQKCQQLERAITELSDRKAAPLQKDQELAHMTGKHDQLRDQFEEKSKILSQTRKELFQVQSRLMALEKDQTLSNLEGFQEENLLLAHFEKEIAQLQEEVQLLESLISFA